jgi:hypothetical protein
MASAGEPTPRTMTMMGGPIDARRSPTAVNNLAMNKSHAWFENNVIYRVRSTTRAPGAPSTPGFLQHAGFIAMNPDRHLKSHYDYFLDLIRGDGEKSEFHRDFYDEYNAVLDMPAEYYLDTIKTVFQDFALVNGTWRSTASSVRPQDITTDALLTIEGELDDISGAGQTRAAHTLCTGVPADRQFHYDAIGAGHYGIFSGRRWRENVYPQVRDFIAAHRSAKAGARKPCRRGWPAPPTAAARRRRRAGRRLAASARPPDEGPAVTPEAALAASLLDALPQTQCRRCGYADCRNYAEAIAAGAADINRLPAGRRRRRRPAGANRPAAQPFPSTATAAARRRARWRGSTRPRASAAPSASRPARPTRSSAPRRACTTVVDDALHRLRALPAGVPGRLHRARAGERRSHRLGRLERGRGRAGAARYARTSSALERRRRRAAPRARPSSRQQAVAAALARPRAARAGS